LVVRGSDSNGEKSPPVGIHGGANQESAFGERNALEKDFTVGFACSNTLIYGGSGCAGFATAFQRRRHLAANEGGGKREKERIWR
jgi:hypothetical protein